MRKNRIIDMVMDYGDRFDSSQDINIAEAMNIIDAGLTKMEIVEISYLYGHMRASRSRGCTKSVPMYNLKQMTDEEWNRLAAKNKAERAVNA